MIEYNTRNNWLVFRKISEFLKRCIRVFEVWWFPFRSHGTFTTPQIKHSNFIFYFKNAITSTYFLICPLHFSVLKDGAKNNRKQLNCFLKMK